MSKKLLKSKRGEVYYLAPFLLGIGGLFFMCGILFRKIVDKLKNLTSRFSTYVTPTPTNENVEITAKLNTKKLKFKSIIEPRKGFLIIDNFTVRPRRYRTRDGYSYRFQVRGSSTIHIYPSLIKGGIVEFPIENAKAYVGKGGIYIVPSENHVVHFVGLCSVPGFDPRMYIYGNDIDRIPVSGETGIYQVRFKASIITVRKGSEVTVEYGLTRYGHFRDDWEKVKKTVTIKTG